MTLYRWQATVQDAAGNAVPGATVEVRNETTGLLAVPYADRDGLTLLGNPFTASDPNGLVAFYAVPGFYRVVATVGALTATWRWINIGALNGSVFDPGSVEGNVFLALNHVFDPTGTGLVATTSQAAIAEAAATREEIGRYSAIRDITGTTDTLVLTDRGKLIRSTNASATTITVPPQASVVWLDRTRIDFLWYGAGQPTFAAGAGVTLRSEDSKLKIARRYGAVSLIRLASNEWALIGNLAT